MRKKICLNTCLIKSTVPKSFLKKSPVIIFIVILSASFSGCLKNDAITVSGAYALMPMMDIWATEYREATGVRVEVSGGGAGKGIADALNRVVDIGMVSREIYPEEKEQGIFWVSTTKDCVVCIINKNNPVVNDILIKGITRDEFRDVFITRSIKTWGGLTDNQNVSGGIKVYTRSDACGAAQMWAAYLGSYTQDDLTNNADAAVETEPGLVGIVASDYLGIGYGNLNSVYDSQTKKPVNGIVVVPIDLNNNNVIDDIENFYEIRDGVVDAVKNDIYPSPPARELYLVTKGSFKGEAKDFVRWILTEGQQYVSDGGYIQLSTQKTQQELNFLEQGYRE